MKTSPRFLLLLLFLTAAPCFGASFTPQNPPEMKPIADRDSPAHQAARHFMRGANLGNYLEVPRGQDWGVRVSADDFAAMRAEGFDHVRVPAGWHHYTGAGPEFTIDPAFFARVDFVVTNALANQLGVLVNIHHFDAFTSDPAGQTEKFVALWRQIAAHYAKLPNTLAFELLNEPKDAATTKVLNPIYARAIAGIRKTNPDRTIFLGPGKWNQVSELKDLVLPNDDHNLIVTVHCYDPFYFTHQGATWAGGDTKVKGIKFPGPPATPLVPDPALKLNKWVVDWIKRYNTEPTATNPSSRAAFEPKMKLAHDWGEHYGRPMHLGEFGAFTNADPESRANFYREFRKVLAEQNIGWAIWDWSAGFRYWDKKNNRAMQGMHEALFGQ